MKFSRHHRFLLPFLILATAIPMLYAQSLYNGFDLSFSIIPVEQISKGGPPKDGIPALTNPPVVPARKARFLRNGDIVVGVTFNGQSRAYPLRILLWHENANDTVGGIPIAVTYCPLCNSVVVFDRRIGGQTREFGISGLLWNSNVLLYDRQPDPSQESLWSQVLMKAVTGPAAKQGLRFKILPSDMTTWKDWRTRHPDTTVLSNQTGYPRDYEFNPYERYFRSDALMFPVYGPEKKKSKYKNKDMAVIIRNGEKMRVYLVKDVKRAAGKQGWIRDRFGNRTYRLEYNRKSHLVTVYEEKNGKLVPAPVAYAYWFTIRAMYPDADVYAPITPR